MVSARHMWLTLRHLKGGTAEIRFVAGSGRVWCVVCIPAKSSKAKKKKVHFFLFLTCILRAAPRRAAIFTFTADQTRCRGRGPGRAAVCRADEKQVEYKSLRTRRKLATTPAWVLSRGISKWRKPKPKTGGTHPPGVVSRLASGFALRLFSSSLSLLVRLCWPCGSLRFPSAFRSACVVGGCARRVVCVVERAISSVARGGEKPRGTVHCD